MLFKQRILVGMSVFTALSKILPPPNYLSMLGAGVDISDTSMKYVSFHPAMRSDKFRILDKWGDISIPESAMDKGEILDEKAVTQVMKEFKEKTKVEYVRISLPEEKAYIFETEIKQDLPADEIHNLLEFRLEENVPIQARDAIFDYEILQHYDDEKKVRVVVAAYQSEIILKYYDVCKKAGITPLSFEVEAQAMARSVIPAANANDSVMLLDLGKTRTGVGIVNRGSLLYTSTIDVGGSKLSEMLRKVLGDISEKEITNIKNTRGLVGNVKDNTVYDALVPTISIIKDEIALRMQYWHQKNENRSDRRIKKIIMCGGSVNLRGLPDYLTEVLGVPCVRGNVWENAFDTKLVVPPIERNFSYGYATAIGLALKNTV